MVQQGKGVLFVLFDNFVTNHAVFPWMTHALIFNFILFSPTSTKLPILSLFLLSHLIYLFLFVWSHHSCPNPEFHHFCHQLHHQLLKWFSWLGAMSPKICSIHGYKTTVLEKYCHHFIHMQKYLRISLISRLCLFGSVQFSRSAVSDYLRPHELQHIRPPCPSPTPGVYPNSCPSSQWCHPAISSSVVPFSSCPPNPFQHQGLF